MLQPSSSSSSSSIDNFDEQKEQLLADRDDALKDTASLKERKLISADVKKERDAEAFRLYDEGLAQLKLGRVSAKQHTPETATSSTTSTGILMCVRVIEGRREVVQRRGVTISPGSTALQAVEAAVDNAAEWQRLSSLPLTVSSFQTVHEKEANSMSLPIGTKVGPVVSQGFTYIRATFTMPRSPTPTKGPCAFDEMMKG